MRATKAEQLKRRFKPHEVRAYFDDAGSDVVVLAGLIGSVPQWEQFERQNF
jgi:hypothetical protein